MSAPAGAARPLPGYVYDPPDAEARAGLLLGSPSGRLFLAGCLGRAFGQTLAERRWRDAAPEEARAAVRAAVARGDWLGLLDLDEPGLLAAVAGTRCSPDGSRTRPSGSATSRRGSAAWAGGTATRKAPEPGTTLQGAFATAG